MTAKVKSPGSIPASGGPLVSIVMSVYNAGEYLRPSLLSIINQTYRNLDIVIINDGSTDGCFETIQDLLHDERICVTHQVNATKPVAVNRALDRIRGEFYAIQDADDISHPKRIERQVQMLLANPHLAAAFCGNELIINGEFIAPLFSAKTEENCLADINAFRLPAHDPTGMFRVALVGDMRFDTSLPVAETYDYILRIGERYPMIVLGECLYSYRILSNSLTRRAPLWRKQLEIDAFRRACERRGLHDEPVGETSDRKSRNSMVDNNIAAHFMKSVLDLRRSGRRWAALTVGWRCACLHPADFHYYKALVYALMPRGITSYLRRNFSAGALETAK